MVRNYRQRASSLSGHLHESPPGADISLEQACPEVHTFPQVPQLSGLEESTHLPLHSISSLVAVVLNLLGGGLLGLHDLPDT